MDKHTQNLTPRAKQLLILAQSIADRMGDSYVGQEHILIALIRSNYGVASNVLQEARVTEAMVLQALGLPNDLAVTRGANEPPSPAKEKP